MLVHLGKHFPVFWRRRYRMLDTAQRYLAVVCRLSAENARRANSNRRSYGFSSDALRFGSAPNDAVSDPIWADAHRLGDQALKRRSDGIPLELSQERLASYQTCRYDWDHPIDAERSHVWLEAECWKRIVHGAVPRSTTDGRTIQINPRNRTVSKLYDAKSMIYPESPAKHHLFLRSE